MAVKDQREEGMGVGRERLRVPPPQENLDQLSGALDK